MTLWIDRELQLIITGNVFHRRLSECPDEGDAGAGEDPAIEADGHGFFGDGFWAVGDVGFGGAGDLIEDVEFVDGAAEMVRVL